MADLYKHPKYYEIVFGDRDIEKECSFVAGLIKKFSSIKVTNILDIACGTGLHMRELSKNDMRVAGLDISNVMLDEAKNNLRENSNLIDLYKNDMSNFKISKKFDACICMVNSLEILTKTEQFILHFASVATCLEKGGIYVMELDNPYFILSAPRPGEMPKEYKKKVKKDGITINVTFKRLCFDFVNSLESYELILNIDDNGKHIDVSDRNCIRRLTPSDIELFTNKNFECIKILGGFDIKSSINDRGSQKMIVVLRRK